MTPLTTVHVVVAICGLALGLAALRFPNGSPRHRRIGKGYLLCWLGIAITGFALGADTPAISPFEILTAVGLGFVALGYGTLLLRRRIGPRWKRHHYVWMSTSVAALIVTAANQILLQALGLYPRWLFWALVLSPFLVLPWLHAKLDRRYGMAPAREPG